MEACRIIGPGRLEAVDQECLEIEFKERKVLLYPTPDL